MATASVTDVARAAATAQFALSSAPASSPTMKPPKPTAARSARPAPAREPRAPGCRALPRERHDPDDHEPDSQPLQRARHDPACRVDRERRDRPGRGDRSDDPHRPDRKAAVERGEAEDSRRAPGGRRQQGDDARERVTGDERPREDPSEPDAL